MRMDDGCFGGVEKKLFLVVNIRDPRKKIRNQHTGLNLLDVSLKSLRPGEKTRTAVAGE